MDNIQNLDPDKLLRTAEILKTIAHPIRLKVIEILFGHQELTVSEIQSQINEELEQSLLSHHLIKLKQKGILKSTKKGLNVHYSLVDKNISSIFECMLSCKLIYK